MPKKEAMPSKLGITLSLTDMSNLSVKSDAYNAKSYTPLINENKYVHYSIYTKLLTFQLFLPVFYVLFTSIIDKLSQIY